MVVARWRPPGNDGPAGVYIRDEARREVEAFNRTGYRDWRRPTRGERKRRLDSAGEWVIQAGIWLGAPAGRFWSAQSYAGYPRHAWCVDTTGRASYLSGDARLHVWLARSGPTR